MEIGDKIDAKDSCNQGTLYLATIIDIKTKYDKDISKKKNVSNTWKWVIFHHQDWNNLAIKKVFWCIIMNEKINGMIGCMLMMKQNIL